MFTSTTRLPNVVLTDGIFASGRLGRTLAAYAQEHGPIFRVTLQTAGWAQPPLVWMVGPEANRFVLHTQRDHFSHDRGWTPLIGESLGKGLLNMDEPEHTDHRRMWNPAFASAYMTAYVPLIQAVIAERTAAWPTRAVVDVYAEAREITFDITAAALAGFARGAELDRLRELFYTLIHGWDEADSWEAAVDRAHRTQQELGGRLLGAIAARRRIAAADQPHDVLGTIIHAQDAAGAELSDMQVLYHLNILLVAGHETTTTLAAWVLYLLATQPAQAARVRAEVDAAAAGVTGPLPLEAIRSLKALDNFVREAGRLYPPVLNLPRGVVKPFEFGGYAVPAGVELRLGIVGTHYLPSVFADPTVFDPDRFAPPREEDKQTPYGLVTFGGGPRICIGMHFANIEVRALAAHVVQHYDLTSVGPAPVHAGGLTAVLPGGVPLRVQARGDAVN
ncbi:MAG: cytochrome P450 [Chloroflexota bacterium]|nr:cytochrome P450 [Chloroflexota bacterium]